MNLVLLRRGRLEHERALDGEEGGRRVEQGMVGEEDEIVLEDGCPYEGGQDPYACLSKDCCTT